MMLGLLMASENVDKQTYPQDSCFISKDLRDFFSLYKFWWGNFVYSFLHLHIQEIRKVCIVNKAYFLGVVSWLKRQLSTCERFHYISLLCILNQSVWLPLNDWFRSVIKPVPGHLCCQPVSASLGQWLQTQRVVRLVINIYELSKPIDFAAV